MSKNSLTSWPEVIVVFHGEYKRTVTHTLKLSHCRTARTTASASHRFELKRSHFREGEVRGAQLARVDEHYHRSACVVRTRWGVPLLKRESWHIINNPIQPQFNDEGAVPVGVPGALVLLPLALPVLQLELSLYTGHATSKRPEFAMSSQQASPRSHASPSPRSQPLKHVNKTITWLVSVVIVLSMPGVGPLQVVHRPVSTGKFSPPTSFSPLQHQGVSPIQHPSLSFPSPRSPPSIRRKVFPKKKKISGEVNRDKTDRRSLVSSRRTQWCVGVWIAYEC